MNHRDIVDLRLAMIRARVDTSAPNRIALLEAINPHLGELLAAADAFLKIKDSTRITFERFDNAPALVCAMVKRAVEEFEELQSNAREVKV